MFLIICAMLFCKFLVAVSQTSISLIYAAAEEGLEKAGPSLHRNYSLESHFPPQYSTTQLPNKWLYNKVEPCFDYGGLLKIEE
jgi:hypothetical protein